MLLIMPTNYVSLCPEKNPCQFACKSATMGGISTGGSDRWAVQWIPVLPLVNGLGSRSQEKQSVIKAAQLLSACCSALGVSRAH